jgi:hypothetical protein
MVGPLFVHTYLNLDLKLGRALNAATDQNPNGLEDAFYEFWDLIMNDLTLNERDYSCCPQGALSIRTEGSRRKKREVVKQVPDFIVYHSRESVGATAVRGVQHTQIVAFIAEVKPWQPAMGDSTDSTAVQCSFNRREFLLQVWDHAKMIKAECNEPQPVWIIQCVGMFWRAGMVEENKRLSPFSNNRRRSRKKSRDSALYDFQWGLIQKIGECASDEELFKFWQQISEAAEYV